ncbi:MAG: histidine kinase [Rikenellaceae bacterium]|nr:histidine kinase [Rikenellaceae bacterium]
MKGLFKINPDELFIEVLISDKFRFLRHFFLLLSVLMLGLMNMYIEFSGNNRWARYLLLYLMIFVPIFLNVYIFVPRLLFRGRPYVYVASVAVSIVAVLLLNISIQYLNLDAFTTIYSADYGNVVKYILINGLSVGVSFSLILAATTSIMILQSWLKDRKRITELETASVIAELDMLKNQINSHFLFNMLNNAIVLAKENPPEAREVILKLREMLNYQLKKNHADKVLLKEDIDFLNDLLRLEKLRRDRFEYYIIADEYSDELIVPPLLFIPFVENALKHGNDNTADSYILIIFKIRCGKLHFFCTNSCPLNEAEHKEGGIGLNNIRRRLELIYGKNYSLDINRTTKTYSVNLTVGI